MTSSNPQVFDLCSADASADLLALIGYDHLDIGSNLAADVPDCGPLDITMSSSKLIPLIDSIGISNEAVQIKEIPAEQFLTSLKLGPGAPLRMLETFCKVKKVKKKKRRMKDGTAPPSAVAKKLKSTNISI